MFNFMTIALPLRIELFFFLEELTAGLKRKHPLETEEVQVAEELSAAIFKFEKHTVPQLLPAAFIDWVCYK